MALLKTLVPTISFIGIVESISKSNKNLENHDINKLIEVIRERDDILNSLIGDTNDIISPQLQKEITDLEHKRDQLLNIALKASGGKPCRGKASYTKSQANILTPVREFLYQSNFIRFWCWF